MALTMKLCEPAAMEVEHAVTAVLQGEVTTRVAGKALRLEREGTALTYRGAGEQ